MAFHLARECKLERVFWQKMEYIHLNAVRAGYVESPEDYVWSSARLVASGQLNELSGLVYKP